MQFVYLHTSFSRMKKHTWVAMITLAVSAIVAVSCKTHYDTTATTSFTATKSTASLAHGKNLVYRR